MAETSATDSPHPDELEYGSEPANEVEADSPRVRGRKRRSADVNNGLVSPSISVEPKDPAQGKRVRGEEGKRVRKANPMFADYLPTDKKTAHTLLGQEPTNGKGRKEVLMTPAEARTKKLAKGYQYVAADEAKPQQAEVPQLPGKRERKKPVHADFVQEEAAPAVAGAAKPKKISVTISNPNTNPTLTTNGGRRGRTSSGGAATPEPALLDSDDKDKPAKRTKSEQSRQAKLDFTLTMLNDQLAAVTSSIRNKETVSLPPVEPEPSNSTVDSPQDVEIEDAEEGDQAAQDAGAYPTTPTSNRGRGNKKVKSDSGGGRAKRARPRAQSPPSPSVTPFSTSRPVRTRKVRTPSSIAGDVTFSRGLVKCQEMVRTLLKHEDAWPFAKPVDTVKLNIPDYFDIIKHPMDLGTIKTQITNGHYDTVDALADDIRLVFINTRTYNKPDSDICIMAKNVEVLFEQSLAAIKAQGFDDLCEDEEPQGAKIIEERIQQLSSQLKVATDEIKRLKKDRPAGTPTPSSATPAKNYKGRPRDDNRPMNFEEKRRLSVQINNLSSEKLMKVVQIIHESNPKVAQSSAPDVIEIDIDALDTSTLRHLERVVRQSQPRQRSTSSASASPAPSRLAQAELAASGTKERIADVKRQLDALNRSLGTKGKKNTKGAKKGEDEDVVIDDEGVPRDRDSDSGSSSDSSSSGSSSESDSSETSSDSDSESDQEQTKPPQPKLPTTANVPNFPFVNTAITAVAMPITTNPLPITPFPQIPPALSTPLPRTPPSHDGVVFSLDKTQTLTSPTHDEGDVPEIKQSTGTKKAPEAISWNTSVLDTLTTVESPATPPPVAGTDQMWSQFQSKNMAQKQKEKDREEQEELLRKEREEREEERKREEERRKKEMEEAEARKQRDSEAEKEQKKKEMMEQRAKAKEERERMQGKNMSEQFDVMASFERENRGSLPSSAPFQLSSLEELQSLPTSSPPHPTSMSISESSSTSAPSISESSSTTAPSTSDFAHIAPPASEPAPESSPSPSSSSTPLPVDSQPSVTPA